MLSDPDTEVLYCTAVALGHRRDPRAIPHLIKLAKHPCEDVRYGVVHGLLTYEDPIAISCLIDLSKDSDEDVRNWAIFGLGTQIETDTLEIRDALFDSLHDSNDEARGEALIGLAERGDRRVVEALLKEWDREFIGRLSIEAAEKIADPRLLGRLESFAETMDLDDDKTYQNQLNRAIKSCNNFYG
ncbi:lyase containing HEAT-repeat [Lentisphaera araneosa HTCC2155]|uniref:Lyase containing HEAT-repeat n=1 Tax=Lentisphaera araneosa HTCC2155 TaxID=313628 RepID=A6DJD2_9BACT|nr:HEAT repeat domain-containing protein [Lentisphaera araneosa]EDM28006.1 lyase containing HEAT-repeat [Lentisphaera araneosa HTCC2155]